MNKFETKTLLSLLSGEFDVLNIVTKDYKNEMGIDIENCFIFFKHNEKIFVIWEKFKIAGIKGPNLDFSEKILSSKMSLKNTIEFLDRTIFSNDISTTGDAKMYIRQNIASVLFDQLNTLSQLDLVNDNFQSYNIGLNFDLLKEKVAKYNLDDYEAISIYKEILSTYGFDCSLLTHNAIKR